MTGCAHHAMGLLSKRGASRQLVLKVSVLEGQQLVLLELARGCHPRAVVHAGTSSAHTGRIKNSASPQWLSVVALPLHGGGNRAVVVTVWDSHLHSREYLGEVRIDLASLFGNDTVKVAPKWYQLYLTRFFHAFVTGKVKLGFELTTRKHKRRDGADSVLLAVPQAPPAATMSQLLVSDAAPALFRRFVSDLQPPLTDLDDQGFYLDNTLQESDGDGADEEAAALVSDVELFSDASVEPESTLVVPTAAVPALQLQPVVHQSNLLSPLRPHTPIRFSSPAPGTDTKTKRRYGGLGKRQKKPGMYELRLSRNVLGVLFLEILSCSDLPPMKLHPALLRFDMDPFVVVLFGKRTFRTLWRKHTLNPIFNERVAFEVLPLERSYNISFLVLDMDRMTFHDRVAELTVPIRDLVGCDTLLPQSSAEGATPPETEATGGESDSGEAERTAVPGPPIRIRVNSKVEQWSGHADDVHRLTRRLKVFRKLKVTEHTVDTSNYHTYELKLGLVNQKWAEKCSPLLRIRTRFVPYEELRRQFWVKVLEGYDTNGDGEYDVMELMLFLESIGSTLTDETIQLFFKQHGKEPGAGALLTVDEIIASLEEYVYLTFDALEGASKVIGIDRCPVCGNGRLGHSSDMDIVTHVAICASKDWSLVDKLLLAKYTLSRQALRKWYSKALIKLAYGKQVLGNNKTTGHILVQDRVTGVVLEEKMSTYIRLGIRLLYNKFDKADTKRVRKQLERLSRAQGVKYDLPQLKKDIASFVQFHQLDLSECLVEDIAGFATFNDFFYRKLKPGMRPVLAPADLRVAVLPADCRASAFNLVLQATELWIKGRNFTVKKLLAGHHDEFLGVECAVGVFRLAPQDYHRFHSPVRGVVRLITDIAGDYYTVNPMAIRLELDVFGENVRLLVCLDTEEFGPVMFVAVGAMMVGLSVFTVTPGQQIDRGDEVGYFKFGGSTVLVLFDNSRFVFDEDLVGNSRLHLETLVRVGQLIGHAPGVEEVGVAKKDIADMSEVDQRRLVRSITGGNVDLGWEAQHVDAGDLDTSDYESESD